MNGKLWVMVLIISAVVIFHFNNGYYAEAGNMDDLSLQDCIDYAMKQNQRRTISKLAVETAEYQLNQALSSFWPQLSLNAGYSRFDENFNFIFPENTYTYTVNIPGLPPLSGQTLVPEQNVTIMEKESFLTSVDMNYPIFTGGMRSGSVDAARSSIEAAKQSERRTELEIIRDVQRMYYGVVLAQNLSEIGRETLIRLETTTDLTERLYQNGSGSVTKLDYLRSQVVLESARSVVERLISNVELAKSALANTMGLRWDSHYSLSEESIPFAEIAIDLKSMVANAYVFNPDWKRLAAGLEAADALVTKEKAGFWPKVALTGSLWRWDNDLSGEGLATDENEEGWQVGVGVHIPVFSGFMTTNKVKEAKARLMKMEAEKILLQEGLALQVKHGVIRLERSSKIRSASDKAAHHAREHRELAVKAYMNELIPTEEVIESQIYEAISLAKLEMALYESAVARFDIDFILGKKVQDLMISN